MADYDAPLVELIRHMKYERVRRAEPETTLINMDFATDMWATDVECQSGLSRVC